MLTVLDILDEGNDCECRSVTVRLILDVNRLPRSRIALHRLYSAGKAVPCLPDVVCIFPGNVPTYIRVQVRNPFNRLNGQNMKLQNGRGCTIPISG